MAGDAVAPTTPYATFLWYANMAARCANEQQRADIRLLAMRNLSPEENTEGILRIMGWT